VGTTSLECNDIVCSLMVDGRRGRAYTLGKKVVKRMLYVRGCVCPLLLVLVRQKPRITASADRVRCEGTCWSASIELCHPLDFIREDGDEAAARAHGRQKKESNGSYVSNLVRGVVVISLKSARSSDLTEKLANDLMNLCSAVAV
jgi:hypothetical protein